MPVKWYNGTIIKMVYASPNTKRFWLQVDIEDKFRFKAGQFVIMDLPTGTKRLDKWRSYSITNIPNDDNILEFCIVNLENGLASKYFFEEVEIGTNIRFKGPDGTFVLPETIDHDLVMISTGTGVAPFRSMLLDINEREIPHKNIDLIFGTRYSSGILYKKEFEDLEKEWPAFSFSVALSRESYKGYQGYVHKLYIEKFGKKRDDIHFYICGWSNMIDDAVANLYANLHYDRTQIHYELYG